jgi:methyl-accepting chemotaxis protein-2 (aspartate sensor receptor)
VGKVEVGSTQVAAAGATMAQVVQSVRRVTDIMAAISNASDEQRGGIREVHAAIAEMDQVTQQNAALVEEAAAAAHALQDQSHALEDVVRIFRIDARERCSAPSGATLPRTQINQRGRRSLKAVCCRSGPSCP